MIKVDSKWCKLSHIRTHELMKYLDYWTFRLITHQTSRPSDQSDGILTIPLGTYFTFGVSTFPLGFLLSIWSFYFPFSVPTSSLEFLFSLWGNSTLLLEFLLSFWSFYFSFGVLTFPLRDRILNHILFLHSIHVHNRL